MDLICSCSQEDYTIFSLPRDLTLSTRTSALPALMGKAWKEHGLHEGWAGLIICMMWEESRGAESKWSRYLGQFRLDQSTQRASDLPGSCATEQI